MRKDQQQNRILLVGLSEIARSMGVGKKTLRRWIKEQGFPARRCEDQRYRVSPQEIEDWWREQKK